MFFNFRNNCHSHVAHQMNLIKYRNKTNYNMIDIWWMCLWRSKYVSVLHIIKTYIGFLIIVGLIFFFVKVPKSN